MIHTFTRLARKTRVTIAVLIALCLVVAQVSAASISCRSDPVIFLSDGIKIQVGVVVETSVDDLISVQYQVHVPANVSINHVIYVPQWAKNKESVTLVADQPADSYQVWTIVRTGTAHVGVTIKSMKFGNGDGVTRQQASGVSGNVIRIGY
ncbi:MAG: hypothetical protein H0X30_07505 [Anaerolineae bacterium]|nr:hypothetical protein [Anaerolineae bacterium]